MNIKDELTSLGKACLDLADKLDELGRAPNSAEKELMRLAAIRFVRKAQDDFVSYFLLGKLDICRDILTDLDYLLSDSI